LFNDQTTGYRCIHGESDGFPGLVLDRYDRTCVLKLYTASWFSHLPELLPLLQSELGHERLVLRLSRNIQEEAASRGYSDGQILAGSPLTEPVIFLENGLRFEADVIRGQKTGFFLDQRENREQAGRLSAGQTVLNTFSFTGGFSLYAARGGATAVTSLDISPRALANSSKNFALNSALPNVAQCSQQSIQADAFKWLAQPRAEQFGIVILDPPALAKKQSEREEAMHAYSHLVRSGIRHVAKNGVLVAASCSAHVNEAEFFQIALEAAGKSGRGFQELLRKLQPADHPATFPEAKYLKCVYLKLQ